MSGDDMDFDYVTPPAKIVGTLECMPAGQIGAMRDALNAARTLLRDRVRDREIYDEIAAVVHQIEAALIPPKSCLEELGEPALHALKEEEA